MGRKKSKTKQKQLGISSGADTTSNEPPHSSSQEDEPSKLSSSNQSEVAGSIKRGGERDDAVFPHEEETTSPRLTNPENTLQDWQNEIDSLSVPEIIRQLKSDSPKPPESHHEVLSLGSAPKVFGRWSSQRKVAELQKIVQGSVKKSQVRQYWKELSNEKKRNFLEVSIHDLRVHHASRRHQLAVELLTEALSFADSNKTWAFWDCFRCGEIFTDQESHRKHVWLHIGNLPSESLPLYPEEVDHSWAELIVNGCWKPFDLLAVVAILHGQRVSQSPTGIGSSDVAIRLDGSNNDHFSEKSVQAVHVDSEAGIVHNEGRVEGGDGSGNSISDVVWCDEKQDEADPIDKGWPLSDDPERSELLEKIRFGFLSLLRLRYLSKDHMDIFIGLAINCLRKIAPGFEPLDYGLEKTHACICLLDAPRLQVVLWFFEKLNHLAVDFKSTTDEDYTCSVDAPVSDGISLNDDLSHLILDKFLSKVDKVSTAENAMPGECSTALVHAKDGDAGREDFVSWIYTSSSGEDLKSWILWREIKRNQGEEVFENLKKIFNEIQSLLKERWDNLCYSNVLSNLRLYCDKQSSQRYSDAENIPSSLEDILRKRQEEFADREGSIEKEVAALVLKEAQRSDGTQVVHGTTSCSSDSIPSLDADSFTEDTLHLANKSIVSGFERQDMKFIYALSLIDVRIRQRIAAMQQLKCKLAVISAFDYLDIVLFLVKTFLQEHLEALVHKEAEMKSDAALEGLLAELELEEKKTIKTKEKLNKGKKKKDQSRAKDPKDTGDESAPAYQENAEQAALLHATSTEVNQWEEIVVTESNCDLKQLEKEFGCKTEVEAEDSLDYPWEIVTKAKHKKIGNKYEKGSRKSVTKAKVTKESPTNAASDAGYQHIGEELQSKQNLGSTSVSLPPEAIHGCGLPKDSTFQHAKSVEKNLSPVDEHPGDSNTKLLEQSGNEEYDDERFQADLKRAIQESIEKISTNSSEDSRGSHNIVAANIERRSDAPGTSYAGNNCLFDVVILTLWRVRRFREEFSRTSKSLHLHVGDPCVVCALYDVFMALNKASTETQRKAVSQADLKTRLRKFYGKVESLQSEQMNDAVDVLNAIFICLHRSISSSSGASDTGSKENKVNSWVCTNEDCIAHHLFGMDIFETIACDGCPMEARCHKYTSFVRFINAKELKKIKIDTCGTPLDALLKHVNINNLNTCNPESGGCGKRKYIRTFLARAPHVFIAVAEQSTLENADDSPSASAAINSELDIGVISCCEGQRSNYCLISVICCNKQQLYSFFSYSPELKLWVEYGNATMKAIDGWEGIYAMMKRDNLRPLVFIFESVSGRYSGKKPALRPVR